MNGENIMNKKEELKIVNKETFKRLVYEKSFEKYGKNIQARIKDRIDKELSMVCYNELSLYSFMIARQLVERAKNHGWTVGNRGSVASSLIAHLLGITQINPLEAHYYCPNCHNVEFHDEFSCGVDMEDKVCQCGTKFEKDGFTIPPETFFGKDGSKVVDIDYNFAHEYQKEAIEHIGRLYGATVVADGVEYTTNSEIMESGRKVFIPKDIDVIFCNNDPSMIRKLESLTNTSVNDIPLDDKKTINLFTGGKTLGISEFSTPFVKEKIIGLVHPQSFDDLIRISAISHGNGTWIDNAERLIAEGKNISEVVSCRDDVMLTLIAGVIEREEAYKISEQIRKGKGLSAEQYAELSNKGIENWKLDSWNRILYTFPRAHAASYVLYAYRMAYYKVHFPLEFYCAYFNTYSDQFDADLLVNHADSLPHLIADMKMNFKHDDTSELIMMEVCQEMYDKGYDFTVHSISNAIKEFIIENGKIAPVLRDIF